MVTIPLTQGQVAVVDIVDSDLAMLKWCATKHRGGRFYVVRGFRKNKTQRQEHLHQVIMQRILGRHLVMGEEVDHIDLNGLNNQRSNLRLANHAENNRNKGKRRDNTSGYKGVSWRKDCGKWRARIKVDKKEIFLGLFDTPEAAYSAYCEAALNYHGEFARLE